MVDAPGRAPIAPTVVGAQIVPETQLGCPGATFSATELNLHPPQWRGCPKPNRTAQHHCCKVFFNIISYSIMIAMNDTAGWGHNSINIAILVFLRVD